MYNNGHQLQLDGKDALESLPASESTLQRSTREF